MQNIIVISIVAICIILAAVAIYNRFSGKGGCGCAQGKDCPPKSDCKDCDGCD